MVMYERSLSPQESSHYEEVARAIEVAHNSIGEATLLLKEWYGSRESKGIRQQEERARQHRQACEKLTLMVREAKHANIEVCIRLSERSESITAHFIEQTEPNLYRVSHGGELLPGEEVLLNREVSLFDEKSKSKKTYFGSEQRYLEVVGIAEVLGNGGALVISAP